MNKRSVCALANALDLIGDKWTLLIIRDLFFYEEREYGELTPLAIGEKISTNILANRLDSLTETGLINKKNHPTNKKKYIYSLTSKGKELKPVLEAMVKWSLKNIKGTRTHPELRL